MTSQILLLIGIVLIVVSAVQMFLIGGTKFNKKKYRFWDNVGWAGCGIIFIAAAIFRFGL